MSATNKEVYEYKKLRNFQLGKDADRLLWDKTIGIGRDMTGFIKDLILGRRQFSPDIEKFLSDEIIRSGKSRSQIIESAVLLFMDKSVNSLDTSKGSGNKLRADYHSENRQKMKKKLDPKPTARPRKADANVL